MKKTTLVLLTVLGMSGLSTPRAEAGILVGIANGDILQGARTGAWIGASAGLAFVIVGESIESAGGWFPLLAVFFTGLGALSGTVLDADTSVETQQWVHGLKETFPFIDSAEALGELAASVQKKLEVEIHASPESSHFRVSLSRPEVIQALGSADLTNDQLEIVVQALK
jgi:hypothetical protein